VVGAERGRAYEHNLLARGDSQFDAYGLRLFADATINDKVTVFSQAMLREATTPYLEGAYVMYTPTLVQDIHLQAGKVPWPIGTYPPRTYSNKNPLIGTPLMYQYHSTLVWYDIPPTADALIATKGQGQYGVNYHGYPMSRGMAIVDDSYWDVGAAVVGSVLSRLEFSGGVMAGTPGWGNIAQDDNDSKSMLGRIGVMPFPGLRLGVSAAYGAYLNSSLNPQLPAGKNANDYHQKLGMADAELLVGHIELRAEGAANRWETPTVGNLDAISGYAEGKYALPFGVFLATRWDAIRFSDITPSSGPAQSWDSDVSRMESGVGYRFDRNSVAKLVYQHTKKESTPGNFDHYEMVAGQLSVGF
jgi:hypothetical protein